ncbi:OLC1v1025952C1 [Oldenlandia corymbosa var. corymbosa]|uniref:OLC1v1025952C1 n=1 Tax=Oldenlandia corymbosa var. corymbosa TaxID=529605 RepID=A0AAV1C7Z8_OLDCO|nr:OLC1v1025952C1 [Oldenlandia corymbosa var. corymbosa]
MRSVRVDVDGPPTKRLVEVSQHRMRDDHNVVRNGTTADRHGMSEEGESRNNEEENDGHIDLQAQTALPAQQQSQHQQQGSYVQWERFLPFRSLQILLVENDDSTRQIVSALLQKCSYQVITASNGLEAWRKLEEFTNQIDLILTEVAMPCLSGIGLLSKIMNHKTFKNIPVIMMSNNDSIGVVYKCLSKGAVDFLLKPIRKNELKILWQHVWRKCHSSSGSGSESGIRTQKSTKSKCAQGSDNNTDSNDEEDDGSIGLNYKDGSDNGSGTQSSWSKRAVEVDSPQPMSPWDDSADPPDSTCAQVIHSRPEAQSSNWVPTNVTRDTQLQNDETDNIAMGKDLRIGVPRDLDLQIEGSRNVALGNTANIEKGSCSTSDVKQGRDNIEKGLTEYHNEQAEDKLQDKEIDLMGAITNVTMAHGRSVQSEAPHDPSKATTLREMDAYNAKELPSLELSLKRVRDACDAGTSTQERNILRHSDHSAFSRYNTVSTTNQAGVVGSCSPVYNSSGAARTESIQNLQSNSSGTPYQGSNGSSNNNDMGSTTNNVFSKSEVLAVRSTAVGTRPGSAFQPVQHGQSSLLQPVAPVKSDGSKSATAQTSSNQQQPQVEHHHHHHYYHHHHHIHSSKQQKQLLNVESLALRKMKTGEPQSGTANMLIVEIEGDAANYGSASGSNNGSNEQNGSSGQNESSAAVVAEGTLTSDNGGAGKSGVGGVVIGSRSGVDQDRLAQREAALNKFRQKRKERCYEKKVRYQSRKKLAEQRPRIRGQFVRQTPDENKSKEKSNDPDT